MSLKRFLITLFKASLGMLCAVTLLIILIGVLFWPQIKPLLELGALYWMFG